MLGSHEDVNMILVIEESNGWVHYYNLEFCEALKKVL